jgi:cellobiose epimerase
MRVVLFLVLMGCPMFGATPGVYVPALDKALKENVVQFWYPRSIDRANGGYQVHFDAAGQPIQGRSKMIVTQARMLWLSARLARFGYEPKQMLEAADHGFRFLRDQMWDQTHGGFYWEVDVTGRQKLKKGKHLYGQAFALYALSEFHLASGRKDVLRLANRLFDVLESKSHDAKFGGYLESFNEDWSAPLPTEPGYLSAPAGMKLMNTHLHLLEAMTWYYKASRSAEARMRLVELIDIESNAVVRKGPIACTDKYDRNWTPRLEGAFGRVSYGHDLENIWLIMDGLDAAGLPSHPFLDLFRALFAYSLKHGYDGENGGFYDSGALDQPADQRNKVWWVQAEALVAALRMYRITGDPLYYSVFEKTWDFVNRHQIDWKSGEWHSTVRPDFSVRGEKGNNWKAGYHNGRALIECLELLRTLPAVPSR